MTRRLCWRSGNVVRKEGVAFVLLLALHPLVVQDAFAGVPDWLRTAARTPLPAYPGDTKAVILLDEQTITVSNSGEISTLCRRACKILRPEGRALATFSVYHDTETRLTFLKAWSITAAGLEYEIKEKDAVETSPFSFALYEDTRLKLLRIPGADIGSVIGYEFEQKHRPYVFQDTWWFQGLTPVLTARLSLSLPGNWEVETSWLNYLPREPRRTGDNRWVWELENVPGIEEEPAMPDWRALAGRMGVTYFARDAESRGKSRSSWQEVGRWYGELAAPRRQSSPAIRKKLAELTTGAADMFAKIRAAAEFVQRDIRYVAIEIGIGGYQPHAAADVLLNRYGDCKDKATLLGAMLHEIGVPACDVIVHSNRGAVAREFVSKTSFNHVITAIRLPAEITPPALFATQNHQQLGTLLFFDPTDTITPFGYLPPNEQGGWGLLVTGDGGELVELPLSPPAANRRTLTAKFALSPEGTLSGEVRELRSGSLAAERRAQFLSLQTRDRSKLLESFLSRFVPSHRLSGYDIGQLEAPSDTLDLRYSFVADNFGQIAGDLLLFRPCILGGKGADLLEDKERKYPLEFGSTALETDEYEIVLPPGYAVDEVPPHIRLENPFADYSSSIEVSDKLLRYSRTSRIKVVRVPAELMADLRKFYQQVATDERSSAVLKRVRP